MKIEAQGWHLEHRDAGHFKFYTVITTANNVVVTHWGRIGTAGQAKIDQGPNAKSIGQRQVHEKLAKGYEPKHEAVSFQIDERDIEGALGEGRARPDPKRLTLLFDKALRDPKFTGEKNTVMAQYEAFLGKAEGLMDRSATQSFESVMNDFDELEAAWKEIEEMHDRVGTTVGLTRQMLAKALLSGKL